MTVDHRLPRGAPEARGIPSSAILAFVEAADAGIRDLHSVMLLRRGQVIAEGWWAPYAPERPHMLFSLSKSFTSTAVGLAVAEGRLAVDDRVLSFFPDDAPAEVGEHLASMRVRDLLTMTTGHAEDTLPHLFEREDGNWARAFLAQPVAHPPGAHFVYNSGATYMLSAIVQGLTGMTLLEYLQPRLLAPLGIRRATWETCPRGINTGGWGLSLTTEDIARFGQLYLQRGVWEGRRLVPEAWVEAATRRQVASEGRAGVDWEQGYGYQFWRCRHGAYRGDGAFGQFCVVMPEQEAVLAITAGVGDMQAVLDLAWEHLLPAFGAAPLPDDRASREALDRMLARLALRTPPGQATSPMAAQVSGRTYRFEPNDQRAEAITLTVDGDGCAVTFRDAQGEHRFASGSGVWREGSTTFGTGQERPVAASGAWTAADSYELRLWFHETPFCLTLVCHFADDHLTVDSTMNVAFGPRERPQLVGRSGAWPPVIEAGRGGR